MKKELDVNFNVLLEGCKKLGVRTEFDLKGELLTLHFGNIRFTVIELKKGKVVEWCDCQEWAKTLQGIYNQLVKKLD